MATVDKTWVFSADNEGLADVGDSAISVYHETAGNPNGGIGFTGAGGATQERARRASTGETWQTWGVPSGNTVTDVQIISWQHRKWSAPNAPIIKFRVVGSGGSTVHSAGDLVDLNLGSGADTGWTSEGAGTSRAVDSGSQASTTDVRLEIQINHTAASSSHDMALDNILLRMTYTAGGGGSPVTAARALSYDILNAVTGSRALRYDISNSVSATRSLSYDILNAVLASRALSYDISNSVQAQRALSYDILNAVLKNMGLSYDILAPGASSVSTDRALNYDIQAAVQMANALSYDILNAVSAARALNYDILNGVTAARALNYDISNNVVDNTQLYYDLGNVVVVAVAEFVSASRASVWQPDVHTIGRRR